MPRKTKEEITKNVEVLKPKKAVKTAKSSTKETSKKVTKKAKNTTKKATKKETKTAKKSSEKATITEKTKATKKSINTAKKKDNKTANSTKKVATKNNVSKKATAKKVAAKNNVSKKVPTKKVAAKNNVSKKAPTKKVATKNNVSKKVKQKKSSTTSNPSKKTQTFIGEYYDLPNHYEQTIVKILAQTPTILFVYWNISSKDTEKLLKQYGENFFYNTYPVLVVINETKNYQFEVSINDYANSWYIHIPDSDCEYEVVLIRKSKNQEQNNSFSITSSNQLETPNDHILFEKLGKTIFFKNVKNQDIQEKDISHFSFMHNIGRIYNIYDLYKEIYKDELNGDELNVKLPSS